MESSSAHHDVYNSILLQRREIKSLREAKASLAKSGHFAKVVMIVVPITTHKKIVSDMIWGKIWQSMPLVSSHDTSCGKLSQRKKWYPELTGQRLCHILGI